MLGKYLIYEIGAARPQPVRLLVYGFYNVVHKNETVNAFFHGYITSLLLLYI